MRAYVKFMCKYSWNKGSWSECRVSVHFTDVTLVGKDTIGRLNWCDEDEDGRWKKLFILNYKLMKCDQMIQEYLVIKSKEVKVVKNVIRDACSTADYCTLLPIVAHCCSCCPLLPYVARTKIPITNRVKWSKAISGWIWDGLGWKSLWATLLKALLCGAENGSSSN